MADTDDNTPDAGGGTGTDLLEREDTGLDHITDKGWNVILLNDPVNLIKYVVLQLQRIFEIGEDKATQYAMTAHQEGKAAVFHGSKDEAATKVKALGSVGLWARADRV